MMNLTSFLELAARKKLPHAPEGFEFFSWRIVGQAGDTLMTGGVPRILKSGPRKGKKTWNGQPKLECVVTRAEVEAERRAFVESTGKCGRCLGEGKRYAGWSRESGHKYRVCSCCAGTGVDP